ncbi:MAG: adenylyl-sulfate kinase [Nitrospirae bacterium]|nr:adenylyl-sulfate kinase [Candidatus Manganitrophaceae bacterium]
MKTPDNEKNVVWHHATVTRKRREAQNGHRSVILWFTGLSSAGKSTLAHALEEQLHQGGCRTFVFDGDNVRHGLCKDLGFSEVDRHENIRRVGEMAKLFIETGVIALTAFISPFRADREQVRQLVPKGNFIEVYCKCSLSVCEKRDPKGLYQRARSGEIKNFTGITSPYEIPENPELVVDTEGITLAESVEYVMHFLNEKKIVNLPAEPKGDARHE